MMRYLKVVWIVADLFLSGLGAVGSFIVSLLPWSRSGD